MKNKKLISVIGAATGVAAGAVLVSAILVEFRDRRRLRASRTCATMGGSQATVLGQTVTSGLTAQSGIQGVTFPATDSNNIAAAKVNNILTLGAVTTSESAKLVNGNAVVTATGETAGVNLLNGLVKIDAVQSSVTTEFTAGTNGVATGSANTTFVGLHVLGANIPINVPENYTVNIGNIATLRLNNVDVENVPSGVAVMSNALDLTLLTPRPGGGAGTEIILNPSQVANMNVLTPSARQVLNGVAYASHVNVVIPHVAAAESGYTAELVQPRAGTENQVVTNATAAVYIPSILADRRDSSTSQKGVGVADERVNVTESFEIGKVNVLQRSDHGRRDRGHRLRAAPR